MLVCLLVTLLFPPPVFPQFFQLLFHFIFHFCLTLIGICFCCFFTSVCFSFYIRFFFQFLCCRTLVLFFGSMVIFLRDFPHVILHFQLIYGGIDLLQVQVIQIVF